MMAQYGRGVPAGRMRAGLPCALGRGEDFFGWSLYRKTVDPDYLLVFVRFNHNPALPASLWRTKLIPCIPFYGYSFHVVRMDWLKAAKK